ncbi:spectrin beta chain, non-erythrocytic 2-like [Pollicipes pollicipes]|uniref:spectrin beta chain, non-erythrocytic 2-like n=1 Tax=Pollicipes pollicipes TaxID=41117 RepID=UPI0018851331|nr:spectrin beta chain, non-erythrocytic 2-like [Pollicipes pollicipes]
MAKLYTRYKYRVVTHLTLVEETVHVWTTAGSRAVRVGFSEPASPSLARRPDGTPLRSERSPTPTGPTRPPVRPGSTASTPSPTVSVTSFDGVPSWAHRAEVWAPGAPGSSAGDPQHKQSSQFDAHIHQLRDEQERMQKKTFLNWINSHLRNHKPPMQMTNLIDDLKDSTRLLALLNVLSGEDLPVERSRVLRTPHFLSNANTALRFLQSRHAQEWLLLVQEP